MAPRAAVVAFYTCDNCTVPTIEDSPPTPTAVVEFAFITILAILTVGGNALIILSIVRFRVLHTITSALILNLVLGDFLIGVTLMPFAMYSCVNPEWVPRDSLCQASGVVNMVFPLSSISTMSAVAVDRYLAITQPLKYHSLMTHSKVGLCLVWVWCQSLLFALLPLSPWSSYHFDPREFLCLIDWRNTNLAFAIACLVVCIIGPLGVMSYCYYHILKVARKHWRRVHALRDVSANFNLQTVNIDPDLKSTKLSPPGSGIHGQSNRSQRYPKLQAISPWENNSVNADIDSNAKRSRTSSCDNTAAHVGVQSGRRKRPKKPTGANRIASGENKSTLILLIVIGTFMLAWLPYIIGSLTRVITGQDVFPDYYFTVSVLIAMLQSSLNPVIYGVMDRRFRAAMKAAALCSSSNSGELAIGNF